MDMNTFLLGGPKSIFILYLLVSCNFLANLFSCRTQTMLNNNMAVKHLLGFMTMYFFVVLVDSESKLGNTPELQMLITIAFYFIFIITTRMDYKWWLAFIVLVSIIYILEIFKTNKNLPLERYKNFETSQKYLTYVTISIIIIGFLIYYGRKKLEYGDDFNIFTFLIGKPKCSFNKEGPYVTNDYNALKIAIFK